MKRALAITLLMFFLSSMITLGLFRWGWLKPVKIEAPQPTDHRHTWQPYEVPIDYTAQCDWWQWRRCLQCNACEVRRVPKVTPEAEK